jgi:hypothetical protein
VKTKCFLQDKTNTAMTKPTKAVTNYTALNSSDQRLAAKLITILNEEKLDASDQTAISLEQLQQLAVSTPKNPLELIQQEPDIEKKKMKARGVKRARVPTHTLPTPLKQVRKINSILSEAGLPLVQAQGVLPFHNQF